MVFDTSKTAASVDDTKYAKGDIYQIQPHSVVVFTSKRNNDNTRTLSRVAINKQYNYFL